MKYPGKKVAWIREEETENARYARFERETEADQNVMLALLNARAKEDDMSRAAKVYDHLLLQLMSLYVSPSALERYRKGFTEDELEAINERCGETWGVVNAENDMMAALKGMVACHPLRRQPYYDDFVASLYLRWQYIDMSQGAGIEALSADGVNVVRD